MDRILKDFLILLLISIAAYSVMGLHCFHCSSDVPGSKCENNVKELKKGVFSKFSLNCSDHLNLSNPSCAIEIRKTGGVIQKIMRSCSDGIHFSFDGRLPSLKVMESLNPETNVTICSMHQGLTCVSLCNTNMCNGPEGAVTSFNSSGTMFTYSMAVMITGAGISYISLRP